MLGVFVGVMLTVICSSTHDPVCIGTFVLFTLACLAVVILRAREMWRNILGQ